MHSLPKRLRWLFLLTIPATLFIACGAGQRSDEAAKAQPAQKNPVIVIKTEHGDITAELYADKAPLTVANFLWYINEKKVHNPSFYRVVRTDPDNQPDKTVKIQVLQGGLTDVRDEDLPQLKHETTKMTGVLHKDGVLSMARNEPGTATHHFSICIGDQPELDFEGKRNPDGQGFAAFGKVTKGMDVVKKLHQQPAEGQYLRPRIKMLEVAIVEAKPAVEPESKR
jgi:peptidyl-prolyl cis-trans isomerase A (cyclophilin A)